MDLSIKNMVCNRCIMVVSEIFEKAGIHDARVQLGKVSFPRTLENSRKLVVLQLLTLNILKNRNDDLSIKYESEDVINNLRNFITPCGCD